MLSVDIDLLWTVINLIILFILVRVFLFKPIHKILNERQKLVDNELDAAKAARAEAEAMAKEQESFRADMDAQKAAAVQESTQKGMQVYEEIIANANAEANKIKKNAQLDAEMEKQAILKETQSEIRDMVLEATARVIGARTDDSQLYDQFLNKAGEKND